MLTYLYLTETGYCVCENNEVYLKFCVPKKLTELLDVKAFDEGYVEVTTNYGEDYIDLKAIADEINLPASFVNLKLVIGRPVYDS